MILMKPAIQLFHRLSNTKLVVLLSSLLLVSCGDPLTTAGIGGTGISYGTVTGFGSIILNGRHLDDLSATVTLDDIEGSGEHGGIKLGMVVKVTGTFSGNTGMAISIEYRDNLEGEVCEITSVGGITTLRVLGQTVILDATTVVDNNASIRVNDIIEVSGLPDELGQIHASYVEVKNSSTEVEVKGLVDTVVGLTLEINNLSVNFGAAALPDGIPTVGQFVEVKGLASDFSCGSPDMLIATRVELEPEGAGDISDGAHVEIEGFVTETTSSGFKIGTQEVVTTSSTSYLPEGFFDTNIVVGVKVEAEGSYDNGVLTATKVVFRENVRLESDVANVSGSSFTLVGFPNLTIETNSETMGDAPAGHIRVRGIEGPNSTILATRIGARDPSTDAFLQGSVESKTGTIISVLGIAIDTSDLTGGFQDVNEVSISRTTFLNLVEPGTLVKFQGTLTGTAILYEEAELEDD